MCGSLEHEEEQELGEGELQSRALGSRPWVRSAKKGFRAC
jgi:hypothetical protein